MFHIVFLHENIHDEDLAYNLETQYIRKNFDTLTNLKIDAKPPSAKGRTAWNKGKNMPPASIDKGRKTRTGMKKHFKNKQEWRDNISKSLQKEKL